MSINCKYFMREIYHDYRNCIFSTIENKSHKEHHAIEEDTMSCDENPIKLATWEGCFNCVCGTLTCNIIKKCIICTFSTIDSFEESIPCDRWVSAIDLSFEGFEKTLDEKIKISGQDEKKKISIAGHNEYSNKEEYFSDIWKSTMQNAIKFQKDIEQSEWGCSEDAYFCNGSSPPCGELADLRVQLDLRKIKIDKYCTFIRNQNLRIILRNSPNYTIFINIGDKRISIMVNKEILNNFKFFRSKFNINPDSAEIEIYCEYPETLNFIKEALYIYEVSCTNLAILFELIMFFNMIEESTLCKLCEIQYRILNLMSSTD